MNPYMTIGTFHNGDYCMAGIRMDALFGVDSTVYCNNLIVTRGSIHRTKMVFYEINTIRTFGATDSEFTQSDATLVRFIDSTFVNCYFNGDFENCKLIDCKFKKGNKNRIADCEIKGATYVD